MITKLGRKWILSSHEGKVLGTHDTKAEAVAQERAIDISKARHAGYRIPRAKTPYRRST